jgi:hypothetical protein
MVERVFRILLDKGGAGGAGTIERSVLVPAQVDAVFNSTAAERPGVALAVRARVLRKRLEFAFSVPLGARTVLPGPNRLRGQFRQDPPKARGLAHGDDKPKRGAGAMIRQPPRVILCSFLPTWHDLGSMHLERRHH